jgi:SAM-dependent methyltransferase
MEREKKLALSFGAAAGDYDRGRPGYPDDAIDWIAEPLAARLGRRPDAVDVGAGTGKFTASLVPRSAHVTAVEPDELMRARLTTNLPEVTALAGSAESIPLADASADLVTFAQSWHWVDIEAASAEVARVLRPDGVLALIWNMRDDDVAWVAQLTRIMGSSVAEQFDSVTPPVGAALERTAHAEFSWVRPMDHEELVAMITSRSYVITMEETERAAMLARIEELLREHPDLAGRDTVEMPYTTRVTIARPVAPRP